MRRLVPAGRNLSAEDRGTAGQTGRSQEVGSRGEAATATGGRGQPERADGRPDGPQGRYGLLLALLIITYLLSAFTSGHWISVAQIGLFVATGFLALRSSQLPRRRMQLITVFGLAGSAAATGLAITRPSDGAVAAASLWTGLLLLATVIVIVRRILSFPTVTGQSILGAISAYLIIGLMFAAFYAVISLISGHPFFSGNRTADSRTLQYFSFTTLTTLGYGDFTAAGSGGRAVAVMEALTGQVFLATLVARLVAAFRGPAGPAATAAEPQDSPQPSGPSSPADPPPGSPAPPGSRRRPPARSRRRGGQD